jgi:hypothetical protein
MINKKYSMFVSLQKADFGWGPNANFNVNLIILFCVIYSVNCSSQNMGELALFGNKWPICYLQIGSNTTQRWEGEVAIREILIERNM